jgi:hypothetical protein
MKTLISRIVQSLDQYFGHSAAPWDAYLAGSRDAIDLERRLNQLERGETGRFGQS